MTRPTLSVIIITKNEAKNIKQCLKSVDFADQIIVVDSNSTDGTQSIVRECGAVLIEKKDWPGFGAQKNFALAQASCDWILSIDADERISEKLKEEIVSAINDNKFDAFSIPRLSSFYGHFIQYGDWNPDYVLRLFKKNIGQFTNDKIHEKFIIPKQHQQQRLKNKLIHYSYLSDSDYLRKLENYSTIAAESAYKKGRKSSLKKSIAHAIWAFLKSYIFKFGFLDGRAGLMVAISSAESTYHKYIKIMLLHEQNKNHIFE